MQAETEAAGQEERGRAASRGRRTLGVEHGVQDVEQAHGGGEDEDLFTVAGGGAARQGRVEQAPSTLPSLGTNRRPQGASRAAKHAPCCARAPRATAPAGAPGPASCRRWRCRAGAGTRCWTRGRPARRRRCPGPGGMGRGGGAEGRRSVHMGGAGTVGREARSRRFLHGCGRATRAGAAPRRLQAGAAGAGGTPQAQTPAPTSLATSIWRSNM